MKNQGCIYKVRSARENGGKSRIRTAGNVAGEGYLPSGSRVPVKKTAKRSIVHVRTLDQLLVYLV